MTEPTATGGPPDGTPEERHGDPRHRRRDQHRVRQRRVGGGPGAVRGHPRRGGARGRRLLGIQPRRAHGQRRGCRCAAPRHGARRRAARRPAAAAGRVRQLQAPGRPRPGPGAGARRARRARVGAAGARRHPGRARPRRPRRGAVRGHRRQARGDPGQVRPEPLRQQGRAVRPDAARGPDARPWPTGDDDLPADASGTTVVTVLQPGYRAGEQVLRPARVAVADPE